MADTGEAQTPKGMLDALKSQVGALAKFKVDIDKLKKAGVSATIVTSLLAAGPQAAGAQAAALSQMSAAEVAQYNSLYRQRAGLGSQLAESELGKAKKPGNVVIQSGAVKVEIKVAGNAKEKDIERAVDKAFGKLVKELRSK